MERGPGFILWLTGLPSAGKSTLANLTKQELVRRGYDVEILDGDVVRKYFGRTLSFSKEDRDENVRRVGFASYWLSKHGAIAIAALISPYRATRREIRAHGGSFVEVYVKASYETCVKRDVKGLYKKASAGTLKNFTGVNDPYEPPLYAEIEVDTEQEDSQACSARILARLEYLGFIDLCGSRSDRISAPEFQLRADNVENAEIEKQVNRGPHTPPLSAQ